MAYAVLEPTLWLILYFISLFSPKEQKLQVILQTALFVTFCLTRAWSFSHSTTGCASPLSDLTSVSLSFLGKGCFEGQ